jgi:glycosyltransferase involved in cell wall biosynthesis
VDVLLKSLALLRSKVHVALIGEIRDPLLQGLIDQQREMVTSLGFRTDATALLGAADLLVVPSRSREGLPKAMMEAMAQGVPVIVTNVGGMPEIVRDGVDGVVVPPEDPAALAGAIDRLVADPSARGAIGMAGQRRVVEQFGADQLVAKTLAMYQGLLTR